MIYATYYRRVGRDFHLWLANACRVTAKSLMELSEVYEQSAEMFGIIADHAEKHGVIASFKKRWEILSMFYK